LVKNSSIFHGKFLLPNFYLSHKQKKHKFTCDFSLPKAIKGEGRLQIIDFCALSRLIETETGGG